MGLHIPFHLFTYYRRCVFRCYCYSVAYFDDVFISYNKGGEVHGLIPSKACLAKHQHSLTAAQPTPVATSHRPGPSQRDALPSPQTERPGMCVVCTSSHLASRWDVEGEK